MITVLIDINVVLDVLLNRNDFYEHSAKILTLCSNKQIDGYLSADSFGTLFYILSKPGLFNSKPFFSIISL
jgi:predicted nucleic acid-binding protein